MTRLEVLRLLGLGALAPLFGIESGERNALDLSVQEFFGRLPCEVEGVGLDKHTSRAIVLCSLAGDRRGRQVEVYTNDQECNLCGRSSFRYRWLTEIYEDVMPIPSPWFCICGYEVGAPLLDDQEPPFA